MKGSHLLALLVTVASSIGCAASSSITGPQLGEPVVLHLNEDIVFPRQDLRVGFTEVQADSRCPPPGTQAVCVWAGVATVSVWAEQPPHPRSDMVLSTVDWNGITTSGRYLDYTLEVQGLTRPVDRSDYALTLAVTTD
jgi:hypothetical protein